MKKLSYLVVCLLLICISIANAQPPQAIPYQAVVRGNSGSIIANQTVALRIIIRDSIASGTIVFSERHATSTNQFGLVTVNIGSGNVLSGNFENIHWEKNDKFLQVEIDTAGGTNYANMGTTQMLSVPYALFSRSSKYSDSTNFNGILYNTPFIMIDSTTASSHDTVFRVDKKGISVHKGREFFFRGIIIHNDTLIITDSINNPVFIVYPDGSSYHKGVERFEGGIVVGDTGKTHMIVLPDGSIAILDSLGKPIFSVAQNGDSYHKGTETFASGIVVGDDTTKPRSLIKPGSLQVVDSAGNPVFSIDSAGNSYHKGTETFAGNAIFGDPNGLHTRLTSGGGIQVVDDEGRVRLDINPYGGIHLYDSDGNLLYAQEVSGNSYHKGFEQFDDDIRVGNYMGANCLIEKDGSITVSDSTGKVVFSVASDGTSLHEGVETFRKGITVGNDASLIFEVDPDFGIVLRDSTGKVVFMVKEDGTSLHTGVEKFENGITIGPNSPLRFDPDGTISIVDSLGHVVFSQNPDGTSVHTGLEQFQGGILTGGFGNGGFRAYTDGSIALLDANGDPVFQLFTDGTSIHKGEEQFLGGAVIGRSPYTRVSVDEYGNLKMISNSGEELFAVDADGTSHHSNWEFFKQGVVIGTPGIGTITFGPKGEILMVDSGGYTVFSVDADGNSYHQGNEYFAGGITVGNSSLNVTGTGTISGNGNGIYNLNASNLSSGTVSDFLLSPNVVRTNNSNYFSQTQTISSSIPGTDAIVGIAPGNLPGPPSNKAGMFYGDGQFTGSVTASAFILENGGPITLIGNGSQITDLNAGNLTTGTVPDERLSPNVLRGNFPNVFAETQTIFPSTPGNDALIAVAPGQVPGPMSNKAGMFYGDGAFTGLLTAGSLSGNGNGITNLNAGSVATGTLSDLRLSSNIPRKNTINVFSLPQSITMNSASNAFTSTNNGAGMAAVFNGNVQINGTLSKAAGTFKIDHPLDPKNKYLYHSFVESPDMMNIYNGNITLDDDGKATISLPEWFGALNKDFRYQLTALGAPGPNLYVSEEVKDNQFKIAGGTPGMKVSWMVTGIRCDAYAETHPVNVEEEKPFEEKGSYLYPEAYKK